MKWRIGLFLVGMAGVAVLYGLLVARIPGPHQISSPYGHAINSLSTGQRNATDAVTAVNFDYRGFDTLGEEFILFVSVIGAIVLLRQAKDLEQPQTQDALSPERDVGPSDAIRVWTLAMTGPTVLFGIYVVTHGQLTPGGGFQGGVILATAPLLIYLAEGFEVFKKITSNRLIEITESIGAGGYAIIGMIAWLFGREYLTNVIPIGHTGEIVSSGTIALISIATGIEVTAGFVLLLAAFLQKAVAEGGEQ